VRILQPSPSCPSSCSRAPAVGINGHPWIEIDFPADFQRAVPDILPAIEAAALVPAAGRRL